MTQCPYCGHSFRSPIPQIAEGVREHIRETLRLFSGDFLSVDEAIEAIVQDFSPQEQAGDQKEPS